MRYLLIDGFLYMLIICALASFSGMIYVLHAYYEGANEEIPHNPMLYN